MTEPGADQGARSGADDVGIYRDGPIDGTPHKYGWTKLCTRAELWAAIEKLEWIAYDAGQADGLGDDDLAQRRDALLAQREYVRDLLGMEAD